MTASWGGGAGPIMNGPHPIRAAASPKPCSCFRLAAHRSCRLEQQPPGGRQGGACGAAARLQRPLLRRARGGVAGHGRVEQKLRRAWRRGQAGRDHLHLRRLLTYLFER